MTTTTQPGYIQWYEAGFEHGRTGERPEKMPKTNTDGLDLKTASFLEINHMLWYERGVRDGRRFAKIPPSIAPDTVLVPDKPLPSQ